MIDGYIYRVSGLVEQLCEHFIGHPTPQSVAEMEQRTGQQSWDIHGCDGCCQEERE